MRASLFRAYDVRGKYPREFSSLEARLIARAVALYFGRGKVVVAHDARQSSPQLYRAAVRGIREARPKLAIISAGLTTTPMFYFLVNRLKAAGGIMVTASHNPKEYNGLKVVGSRARPVGGKELFAMVAMAGGR